MNNDQHANLETMVTAISETLVSAWSYFHLLEGLHGGSKANPIVVQRFNLLFNELWRAVFDGLFSKAGTLIDHTKNTYSIPNLVKLATRYGDPDLKAVARCVDVRLKAINGPLKKIKSWRHEAVAHSSPSGRADVFYQANKMGLNEVADGLGQLEQLLNELSMKALGWVNDTRTGSQEVVQQGLELFACITNADREQIR